MRKLYAVIELATGDIRFGQAYTEKRNAKLALKNRLNKRDWQKHGVAEVIITPTVVSTVMDDGKWTEVSADADAS